MHTHTKLPQTKLPRVTMHSASRYINCLGLATLICFLGQIDAVESIFTYESGESVTTFSEPNHIPPFMDEILPSLRNNATLVEVCGDNIECLFDFSQTGDAEFGMATVAVEDEATSESLSACE